MIRYYRYIGEPILTRGDYGVRVTGGHSTEADPDGIYIFDPDFGEQYWGIAPDPDFEEVSAEEHAQL